jgi:hypothetical protein
MDKKEELDISEKSSKKIEDDKQANVSLNFETGEATVTDSKGEVVSKKTLGKKVSNFLVKAFNYSPIGLSYNMSKSVMDSSIRLLDRAINENELNKIEPINFSDILDLIRDGKDRFETLDMTFNASKVNGLNVTKAKEELQDSGASIDFGKKGDLQMMIKVKYK